MKRYILIFVVLAVLAFLYFPVFKGNTPDLRDIGKELNKTDIGGKIGDMKLTSAAFENGGKIPSKYTCDGDNINIPLSWSGVPAETKSLVLIMDDPDIPDSVKKSRGIEVYDHLVAFNIPPADTGIPEGKEPNGVLGSNGAGKTGYTGPCPPDREHRYFFKLYALDTTLSIPAGGTKKEVLDAMDGHIIAQTELMGFYDRIKK